MPAQWVTVEAFSQQTGIKADEANRKCNSNEWPQGLAWMYYSERKRLINLEWWNRQWEEQAKAYAKQQNAASKSNSFTKVSDAVNGLSSSQIMRGLEKQDY